MTAVIYGCDGALSDRLADLAAVLGAVGWGERSGDSTVPLPDMPERDPPAWPLDWSPAGGLGFPAGLETGPPPDHLDSIRRWVEMGIGWISRGQPTGVLSTGGLRWTPEDRTATPVSQPVEVSGEGADRLAARALERHQHAIAIQVEIRYYVNFNVNARPGRLRKRLLPVR